MAVSVHVDHDVCQGHGLCYFESDELFTLRDEDGRSVVQLDPVPPRLHDAARRAVNSCPERAITIVEDD